MLIRRLLSAVGVCLCVVAATSAHGAQLIMFHSPLCAWCEAWELDVGSIYSKTAEGRAAPLRRRDIDERRPAELYILEPVVYTPTFVLVDDRREVGRIVGYPDESHFWGLLGLLLEELHPRRATASRITAWPKQR